MLFTFLTTKEGSITIEQFAGGNLRDVSQRWYRESSTNPGAPLEGVEDLTPVSGVQRVWCVAGTDSDGRFSWTHIVETATAESE